MDALRDQRGLPWLDDLTRDLRHGVRTLGRTPTFTAVVLLTLAIGIGANTAVFSVVNSVLLRPLPYPQPERLVAVWHTAPGASGMANLTGDLRLSPSMYFTYAEQNRTFEHIGVWFAGIVDGHRHRRAGAGAQPADVGRHASGARRPAAARTLAVARRPGPWCAARRDARPRLLAAAVRRRSRRHRTRHHGRVARDRDRRRHARRVPRRQRRARPHRAVRYRSQPA